jgi:mono/diheme cytochrome c family protein
VKKVRLLLMAISLVLVAGGVGYYLFGAGATGGIDANDAKLVAEGGRLYARECAACHGRNLQGQTSNWRRRLPDGSLPAPPHDASGHTWHHPDQVLFNVTKHGRSGAARAAVRSNMPAFGKTLTDREIWAVLSFIKSRWPPAVVQRHDAINRRYRASR